MSKAERPERDSDATASHHASNDVSAGTWARLRTHALPILKLCAVFCAWKTLLLLLAIASPGEGYDTSTVLLFSDAEESSASSATVLRRLAIRLTRWDAIYFSTAAHRGHLYEQEWAFSPALARWTCAISKGALPGFSQDCQSTSIERVIFAGSAISHLSHLGAVIGLYTLTHEILPAPTARLRRIAFTAASLHVFSPAGLFLSASYGESLFAMFAFWGLVAYSSLTRTFALHSDATSRPAVWKYTTTPVISASLLGLASIVRSNGLLYGIILILDLVMYLPYVTKVTGKPRRRPFVQGLAILLSGLLMGSIYAWEQYEAYQKFCTDGRTRPWCRNIPPSIYTWVQSHYWNNGFLRYWTLSNAPLFLIALPMLAILSATAWIALREQESLLGLVRSAKDRTQSTAIKRQHDDEAFFGHMMNRTAIPQLLLVCLCFTSFHVQIISRLSSGFPLWYIVLAIIIHADDDESRKLKGVSRTDRPPYKLVNMLGKKRVKQIVRGMVIYAVVQGGLYASFLPPA